MTNHLGNVLSVISDRKLVLNNAWVADVQSYSDYYPGGMQMPNRNDGNNDYRYGFGGHEKDGEVKGNGNHLDFGARCYDSRLGRFLSLDAYAADYPSLSDYAYVANNPIILVDPDGNVIDLSNLTAEQLTKYNSTIEILQNSDIFAYYYKALINSEEVYTVMAGGVLKDGERTGGGFDPKTGNVNINSFYNTEAISQELFHAFQTDRNFYSQDDHSVVETEGDILTRYIELDAGTGFGSNVAYNWDQEILNEYGGGYDIPLADEIDSEKYQALFTQAVDKRITMYTEMGVKEQTNGYDGYTTPNSGNGPLALQKVKKESEAKDLVGPRLENGDYYAD